MLKELEILFRKLIFNLLILLSSRKRSIKAPDFTGIKRVGFIRLNRIGDALVVTPVFSALKKKYDFEIVVLADRKNHFVFNNNPSIDKTEVFKKGISGFRSALSLLNSCDIVVDLHDDVSTTVSYLVALSKSPHKFALQKENFKLFSQTVPKLDPTETHVVERVIQLLKLFNCKADGNENIEFFPNPDAKKTVQEVLHTLNPTGNFHLGINISAGSDARFWGIEKYRQLITEIKSRFTDIVITVVAAPSDIDKGTKIAQNLCDFYYSKSFDEFAEFIAKLDFLFTPDTSTVHLASSAKIPMFGLYVKYNTDNKIWYPYRSEYDCVVTSEPNFDKLNVEDVLPSFLAFFEKIYYGKKDTKL